MGFGRFLAYRIIGIIGRLFILIGVFGLIVSEPKGSAILLAIGLIIEAYVQFKQGR